MSMFDMYKPKKKRPVDPNAPPRPNLLSHEKVLKDAKVTLEQLQFDNNQLKRRMEELEAKMRNQTSYLSYIHQFIARLTK